MCDGGPLRWDNCEVRALLTGVAGFRSWGMVRTQNGAYSITVCEDKAGCDETVRIAAEWTKANVSESITPPTILEGETVLRFVAEGVPA